MTLLKPQKPGSLHFISDTNEISVNWPYTTLFDRFKVIYGRLDTWPSDVETKHTKYRTYRITELQPDTQYYVQVFAEHDGIESEPSEAVATTLAATA